MLILSLSLVDEAIDEAIVQRTTMEKSLEREKKRERERERRKRRISKEKKEKRVFSIRNFFSKIEFRLWGTRIITPPVSLIPSFYPPTFLLLILSGIVLVHCELALRAGKMVRVIKQDP